MSSQLDKVALVTGACSGIGAATAKLLVEQGTVVYNADLKVSENDRTDRAD